MSGVDAELAAALAEVRREHLPAARQLAAELRAAVDRLLLDDDDVAAAEALAAAHRLAGTLGTIGVTG